MNQRIITDKIASIEAQLNSDPTYAVSAEGVKDYLWLKHLNELLDRASPPH